jgi:hypothetical protein
MYCGTYLLQSFGPHDSQWLHCTSFCAYFSQNEAFLLWNISIWYAAFRRSGQWLHMIFLQKQSSRVITGREDWHLRHYSSEPESYEWELVLNVMCVRFWKCSEYWDVVIWVVILCSLVDRYIILITYTVYIYTYIYFVLTHITSPGFFPDFWMSDTILDQIQVLKCLNCYFTGSSNWMDFLADFKCAVCRGDPLRWPRDTLYPQKLALTSPTSGGRSVGIFHLQTKFTEFSLVWICKNLLHCIKVVVVVTLALREKICWGYVRTKWVGLKREDNNGWKKWHSQ